MKEDLAVLRCTLAWTMKERMTIYRLLKPGLSNSEKINIRE